MRSKGSFIIVGIFAPVVIHVLTVFAYAYGGYDGENCSGLLDAVWKCSEFEYYIDWVFNPFTLIGLFGYLLLSAICTPIAWHVYKKI